MQWKFNHFQFADDEGEVALVFLIPKEGEMTVRLTVTGVTQITLGAIATGGGENPPPKTVIVVKF